MLSFRALFQRTPAAQLAKDLASAAAQMIEKNQFGEASAMLDQARKLDPSYAEVDYRAGLIALDRGDPSGALNLFDAAVAKEAKHARAINDRGSALLLLGRHADAEKAFRAAMLAEPLLSPPRLNLVHLCQQNGRIAEAATICSDAIKLGVDT
jgi:tetratricopeptide (TPR) repeat protein